MEPSTRRLKVDIDSLIQTGPAYITTHKEFGPFVVSNTVDGLESEYFKNRDVSNTEFLISTRKDMLSPQTKVLMQVEVTFYHFFMDTLPLLLKIHKEDPGVLFILYLEKSGPNTSYESFLELLFNILDSIGANYIKIPTLVGKDFAPVYEFNNYILLDSEINLNKFISFIDIQYMVEMAVRYSKSGVSMETYLPEPFRKVYITRAGKGANIGPVSSRYEHYRDDLRMDDEWKLEEFFAALGYEIITPETKFDSVMEQIGYMREVKTLVAVTCSGLMNMVFMQEHQTVIEIQAELVQILGGEPGDMIPQQNLHNFYQPLSFINEHTYIAIPSRRDPDRVIEALSKDAISYVL